MSASRYSKWRNVSLTGSRRLIWQRNVDDRGRHDLLPPPALAEESLEHEPKRLIPADVGAEGRGAASDHHAHLPCRFGVHDVAAISVPVETAVSLDGSVRGRVNDEKQCQDREQGGAGEQPAVRQRKRTDFRG